MSSSVSFSNQVMLDWVSLLEKRASAEVVSRFVLSFFEEDDYRMKVSEHGRTDITFICSRVTEDDTLEFILKYISPSNSKNTQFCSEVLHSLSIDAPIMYEVPQCQKFTSRIAHFCETKNFKRFSDLKDRNVLLMPAFPGCDLTDFIRHGSLFHLPEEDWRGCLAFMGTIAVFDLFLGNGDRFWAPEKELDPEWAFPLFNGGNLMIETSVAGTLRRLENIYLIDNVSSVEHAPNDLKFIPADRFSMAFAYFYPRQQDFARMVFKSIQVEGFGALTEFAIPGLFTHEGIGVFCLTQGISAGYAYLQQHPEIIAAAEQSVFKCEKIMNLMKACMEVFP